MTGIPEDDGLRLDTVNERLRIYQFRDGVTFGTDALLLAAYVKPDPRALALEFGGGCGIVSLLLAARRKAARILALEAQPEYVRLIERNAAENGLSDVVSALCTDVRDVSDYPGDGADLIVSNPPYLRLGSGKENLSDRKNAARRETKGGIADFCRAAAKKLTFGGRFVCVYLPARLPDLLSAMEGAGIAVKRMTVVSADPSAIPSLILAEGRLGAKPGMRLTRPLFLYSDHTHKTPSRDLEFILNNGCFPDGFGDGTDPKKKGNAR